MTTEQAPSELTDKQIDEIRISLFGRYLSMRDTEQAFARAVIAADRALVASQAQPAAEPAPLTIEFIDTHIGADEGDRDAVHEIVREVEEAHGIRTKRMRGQFIPGFTADESVAFWTQQQPAEPRQDSVHSVESSSPLAAALGHGAGDCSPTLYLDAFELKEALEFATGGETDNEALQDIEVALARRKSKYTTLEGEVMNPGLYLWFSDYPEEGAIGPLGAPKAPASGSVLTEGTSK